MPTRIRSRLAAEAERRNREQLARLGGEIREGRHRKRLTQAQVGLKAGLSQSAVSRLERGLGGGLSVDVWQRVGLAIDQPLTVAFQRDIAGETADAGHLAIQELILGFGRAAGYLGRFELVTRPAEPWRSTDVGLLHDRARRLILVECWNTIGDVGAAARSSERKRAEADAIGAARWGEERHRVSAVWVVRATARNRAIVARYPEVFASRFPGSSAGWVRALCAGAPPPAEPGLAWCDVEATRLFAWRRAAPP
jgi:transcriptional regulator with XRE-family HTH domain